MIISIIFIIFCFTVLFYILSSIYKDMEKDNFATKRQLLEEEKQKFYNQLKILYKEQNNNDSQEIEQKIYQIQKKAAFILKQIDLLPLVPATGQKAEKNKKIFYLSYLFGFIFIILSSIFIFPNWQKANLRTSEQNSIKELILLPQLREKAKKIPSKENFNNWGDVAFNQKNYIEAMQAYTNSLQIEQNQPKALRRLGSILLNQEQILNKQITQEEAEKAFLLIKTAFTLDSKDPESYLLLGFALAKFEADDEALQILEQYQNLQPNSNEADSLILSLRKNTNIGAKLWAENCIQCHGTENQMLIKIHKMPREMIKKIIIEGKGTMPAFKNIQGDELQNLIDEVLRLAK